MNEYITMKSLIEDISMLNQDQKRDVMEYVAHLQEIESLTYTDPKEYAKVQIRRALENGFSF